MPKTLNVGSPSIFVTVTAWVAIVLAALVSAVALVQRAEVASLLPQWQHTVLPPASGLLLQYLPWVLGAAAVLSLLLVAGAVGLLLRLEWARRVFIGLAALAIVANLLGLWLQYEVVHAVVQATLGQSGLPASAAGSSSGLTTLAQLMGLVLPLAACGLLGWVIRGLNSERVRQEFA
jgi:hypothetical protein